MDNDKRYKKSGKKKRGAITVPKAVGVCLIIAAGVAVGVAVYRTRKKRSAQFLAPAPESSAFDDGLLRELADVNRKALTAEAYRRCYGKIFAAIAEPLQWLLGIAADAVTEPERLAEYLRDIVREAKAALGAGYTVSEPAVESVDAEFLSYARDNLSREEIERKIRNLKNEGKPENNISFAYKAVIDALGGVMPNLERAVSSAAPDMSAVDGVAKDIDGILRNSGIFPLGDQADGIAGKSELPIWFAKTNPGALKYPALFIKRGGEYELLGDYRGSI
jgi:hypothetical protein